MPMMKRLTAVAAALLLALSASLALALNIGEAKSRGLVGETATGYIAAVQASPEVNALIADINAKRKAQYRRIAQKNGISLEAVEVRAGQRAMEKTPPGQFVNRGSGWERK